MVQPDGVADDLSCKPMAIVGVGWRRHPTSLIALRACGQTGYRDNAPEQQLFQANRVPEVAEKSARHALQRQRGWCCERRQS